MYSLIINNIVFESPMQIIKSVTAFQTLRHSLKHSIGFVATMGCLHAGHASLIARSKSENDLTILSIFVNPTQFNNAADLENYPITHDNDLTLAKQLGVDVVFMPDKQDMYPHEYHFKVNTDDTLSLKFEGQFRPGHYDGVLSIVMKLLNLTKPTRAYFGEKDFQQYLLIKRMTQSFFMDVAIVMCPTVREDSGLALSSRNVRLNAEQKERAIFFAQTLKADSNVERIKQKLQNRNIGVDYIEYYENRLLAAVTIDDIRLIDNRTV